MRLSSIVLVATLAAPGSAFASDGIKGTTTTPGPEAGPRRILIAEIDRTSTLPADLLYPEGKSRWDLRAAVPGRRFVRTIATEGVVVTVRDDRPGAPLTYTDSTGGNGAVRFLLPDRDGDLLRPGARARIDLIETASPGTTGGPPGDRLAIDLDVVGIGWVDLPSGPREVVLQRLLVLREKAGRPGFVPDRLAHRFVDPRAGTVAEISSPMKPGGGASSSTEAWVLESVLAGAADLRLYVSDLWGPPFSEVNYGRDRGAGTAISSLTTAPGVTTMGDLINLPSWDFSINTTGIEVASTTTTVTAQETCNYQQCGYTVSGGQLERTDRNFPDPANVDKINDVAQLEERTGDTVIWLRAGAQHEGKSGSLGSGESRFCYTTFGGVTRTPAPLWQFTHQDAPGGERYILPGDRWSSAPFACEQNIFNQVCGASGTLDRLYIKACGTHTGTQWGEAIKAGPVTVPSGHTFNAILVRNVADFCVYIASGCSALFKADEVRTVNYLWQVPHLGTVARLQSAQNVADATSFTTVAESDFVFGLYPPRSMSVTGSTDTTVSLSWDPGLDTHRISGYKVYWDSDPGAASAYAFDSVRFPGQAALLGTTAVISGLTPGTTYYFTVTALSAFTDPSTSVTTTYESLIYPAQVSGDPAFVYPVEVTATTTGGTCIPTAEVTGLTVAPAAGGIQICWDPVSDRCLAGYEVLGASSPASADGFSVLADTDLGTCWTGDPSSSFFLVVARGTGGTGPWGHYGR